MRRSVMVNTLAFEYPGYSTSQCPTTSYGCEDANMAAYRFLTEERRIPPSKIIFFGLSLGTGPTVQTAGRVPHAGMILQSPFMSAYSIQLPWNLAHSCLCSLFDIFQTYRVIPKL